MATSSHPHPTPNSSTLVTSAFRASTARCPPYHSSSHVTLLTLTFPSCPVQVTLLLPSHLTHLLITWCLPILPLYPGPPSESPQAPA